MAKDTTIVVAADPARPLAFTVTVSDAQGQSRHRVTISDQDAARYDSPPQAQVEAAMRFLIDREPKDSILAAFDIGVIRRYFPDFDAAFPAYLTGKRR